MATRKSNHLRKQGIFSLLLVLVLVFVLTGCGKAKETAPAESSSASEEAAQEPAEEASEESAEEAAPEEPAEEPQVEKNGELYILFTNDIHCGVDQGFGFAGLWQIRETLEAQGYETLLVDSGDAIQGSTLGMLSKGSAMIELMNAMQYDAAVVGNHEFDYTVERLLELAEMADFPYLSCNFNREGESIFQPYVIKECAGIKIGFVGVTTPTTLTCSTPKYFQNETGEFIYDFCQDDTGQALYDAVQSAVDAARAEGAQLVFLLGHLGMNADDVPWTYADVLAATNGIDIMFDAHTHDTEQVEMVNKDGDPVQRYSTGTKLKCVGYCHISAEGAILDTGILSWPNSISAPDLLGIQNDMGTQVQDAIETVNDELNTAIASSTVDLTIYDPEAVDSSGDPIRIVRRMETNLGDLCSDAIRGVTGADIVMVGGGNIRANLSKGDITYYDLINVFPFGNQIALIRVSGQQVLDALEWGVHALPNEFGSFMQVSGLSYEVDLSIPSEYTVDENTGMLVSFDGERRVKNVYVGDEPLDPDAYYVVAGTDYAMLNQGDGITAFDGAEVISDSFKMDYEALSDYIINDLNGEIGGEYADPYGQGRITITDPDSTP